jgi:CRISPR-associated protein Csb3
MKMPEPSFSVNVDVTNPGQFFGCCGLLELAHRLWGGAEGWFGDGVFCITAPAADASIVSLAGRLRSTQLCSDDPAADDKTCPLRLRNNDEATNADPPLSLRLDWWLDEVGVGGSLKTWAGQQRVTAMGGAMLHAAVADEQINSDWLNSGSTGQRPGSLKRAVEPFYFDARRFANALDTGFSLDAQEASTTAHPATEFLALVGLQRFRPETTSDRWSFEYWTWAQPLSAPVAAGVACGAVPIPGRQGYRFPLRFRDNQKRYKAFSFATQIGDDT